MASSSGLWNMVLPEPTKVQKACDGAEVHLKAGLNAKNNSRRKLILSEAGLKYLYIALENGVSYFYLYFCWKIEGVEKEGYFKSDKHSVFFPCYSMHCECTSCLIPGSPACILFHTWLLVLPISAHPYLFPALLNSVSILAKCLI